jgi:4-hydroxy-2-oxoheptanedioate aldolase
MPKRINKVIELLEQGQPIYSQGTRDLTYENGKKMAKTWADYIGVEMEHGAFDMAALGEFMRGLADGGPTSSGHRTPPVIMTIPTDGTSEEVIRANAWMMRQVLARGIHGILLCHAETPGAVKAFVESCRYPFQTAGIGKGLDVGRRGGGGQRSAAEIWGLNPDEYMKRADPWPLNPEGELFLGLKLENKRALANCEASAAVPGIAFAEWGPGDMGLSFGYPDAHDPPYPDDMEAARQRVMSACKSAGIAFLCSWNTTSMTLEQRVKKLLDDGTKIVGGVGEEGAKIGRKLTNRTMPV